MPTAPRQLDALRALRREGNWQSRLTRQVIVECRDSVERLREQVAQSRAKKSEFKIAMAKLLADSSSRRERMVLSQTAIFDFRELSPESGTRLTLQADN